MYFLCLTVSAQKPPCAEWCAWGGIFQPLEKPDLGAAAQGFRGLAVHRLERWLSGVSVHVWSVSGSPERQAHQAGGFLPGSFPSRAWAQLGYPTRDIPPGSIPLGDTLPLLEDVLWGPKSESFLGFGSELDSPELAKATSMGSGVGVRT